MPMFLLPRRAPFSDWKAQIERIIARDAGEPVHIFDSRFLRAYYDCGVTPQEVASELSAD